MSQSQNTVSQNTLAVPTPNSQPIKTGDKTPTQVVKIVPLNNLSIAEQNLQQERMRDVYLLLQNMTFNEEATIKLIIECLYDVGSINIINKKITNRPLNRFAKFIAKTPKPIVKIIAWRWVKKNLPRLVTRFLYNKVKFK